jgi:UDP:flavonoid glycosyltransferase YjiC (YdhE family)
MDYDQFDHAARLVRANLAVRIHRSSNFAEVLSRVLRDNKLTRQCKEFQSILERSVAKQEFMAALQLRLGG